LKKHDQQPWGGTEKSGSTLGLTIKFPVWGEEQLLKKKPRTHSKHKKKEKKKKKKKRKEKKKKKKKKKKRGKKKRSLSFKGKGKRPFLSNKGQPKTKGNR